MKQRAYTIALLAAALLAACQQEDDYRPQPERNTEVITFSTPYYARSAQMRYGNFEQGDQVGVLGYCLSKNPGTGSYEGSSSPWDTKKVFAKPDVFYNTPLTYNNGTWGYNWESGYWGGDRYESVGGLHPWHNNEDYTYAFFAYYPYAAGTPNRQGERKITINGIDMGTVELSEEDKTGDPTITYTLPHNGTNLASNNDWRESPDFMLAYATDHRKADGSVRLNFRHLLCAFEFEINNYNPFPITVSDLYVQGGTEGRYGTPETGFYRSVTVTGQESGYTIGNDIYIGEFNLIEDATADGIVCPGATVDEETGEVTPYTMPVTVDHTAEGERISLLFIPDANGKITSDGNENISLSVQIGTDEPGVAFEKESSMNLKGSTFQPGVRSIFSINVVGNDFYLQMRSDGTWENDGDSDIVFE